MNVRVVAVVLAAGSASRFGSAKQLATLDGRPLLQHPLDALAAAGVDEVVVVLGVAAPAIEAAIEWRGERRVVNHTPDDGLASSLRVGLSAVVAAGASIDAILVVLGDQPSLRPSVITAVLGGAVEHPAMPFVRARYAHDGAPNPVLVRRGAWDRIAALEGDRGLGPLLAEHRELVLDVPVDGAIPDVDTPADLAALAAVEAGR